MDALFRTFFPVLPLQKLLKSVKIWQSCSQMYTATQGRSHRGGHGGRVPRAPYHVPLHQSDNTQFVSGANFWRVTWRYITAYN